jgi:proline dehydrogenase
MSMFRGPVLAVANRPTVEKLIRRNGLSGKIVARFVAGESLEPALTAIRPFLAQGMQVTMDQLGENVSTEAEARAAVDSYVTILRRMQQDGIQPNISIKLTMLGLDLGDDLVRELVRPILTTAREAQGFVRIDMEGSLYTARTVAIFEEFHDDYPDEVGIVIQTYLKRARADVERMIARKARVRLVKGAYAEPATVALQEKPAKEDNYRQLMELLLAEGRYPAIATHDPAHIAHARAFARQYGIGADRFEFQMLYGVRRDEQANLVREGWRMRIYVPYGTEWYPYFTRRIAERPANAIFVLRQMISG